MVQDSNRHAHVQLMLVLSMVREEGMCRLLLDGHCERMSLEPGGRDYVLWLLQTGCVPGPPSRSWNSPSIVSLLGSLTLSQLTPRHITLISDLSCFLPPPLF